MINDELAECDLFSKKTANPVKDHFFAGEHETVWNAPVFSSGIYIVRLVSGNSVL